MPGTPQLFRVVITCIIHHIGIRGDVSLSVNVETEAEVREDCCPWPLKVSAALRLISTGMTVVDWPGLQDGRLAGVWFHCRPGPTLCKLALRVVLRQ